MTEGWQPHNPDPVVKIHDGIRVVRDDMIAGTKTRAADLLLTKTDADHYVYVQPRAGLAGVSLLDAANRMGKKVTLFMPSSKRVSEHQACCIERGAEVQFHRIAAMPNLNRLAKAWAEEHGHYFVPLGLRHELATAAIVHAASKIPEPEEVYVAISTGVLTRSLQIAWPNAKFTCVAVARNLKAGEAGPAKVVSDPLDFLVNERQENLPKDFETVPFYDGKVWKWIPKDGKKDRLFWNVGKNPVLNDPTIYDRIDSYREWPKKCLV